MNYTVQPFLFRNCLNFPFLRKQKIFPYNFVLRNGLIPQIFTTEKEIKLYLQNMTSPNASSISNISPLHFISINLFWFADKFACKPFLLPLQSERRQKRSQKKKICSVIKLQITFWWKPSLNQRELFQQIHFILFLFSYTFSFFHSIFWGESNQFHIKEISFGT